VLVDELVRAWRRERRGQQRGQMIETERGSKEFAAGDRLYFLRNERSLGVKNGSLCPIEKIGTGFWTSSSMPRAIVSWHESSTATWIT
jgi:ATP-dependent exoDNAse (exonuclease V) alpha subunit